MGGRRTPCACEGISLPSNFISRPISCGAEDVVWFDGLFVFLSGVLRAGIILMAMNDGTLQKFVR